MRTSFDRPTLVKQFFRNTLLIIYTWTTTCVSCSYACCTCSPMFDAVEVNGNLKNLAEPIQSKLIHHISRVMFRSTDVCCCLESPYSAPNANPVGSSCGEYMVDFILATRIHGKSWHGRDDH